MLKSFRGHPPLREWKGSRVSCSLYVTMRLNVIGVSCQLASENTFDLRGDVGPQMKFVNFGGN